MELDVYVSNSNNPRARFEDIILCIFIQTVICRSWGLFLESPENFSGPESYFMCAMFALKTQILLALKAEQ